VVPRALAASSQCPRRKSLLEASSTSMSVNSFWNSWDFCLQQNTLLQKDCATDKLQQERDLFTTLILCSQ
jgi:hypothetical protein